MYPNLTMCPSATSYLQLVVLVAVLSSVSGCGGSSSSASSEPRSENNQSGNEETEVNHVGYYPAVDGSGYFEFETLNMPEDGYLDLTKHKTSVSLYQNDLTEIDSELSSRDFITAGQYKVKINYKPTSLIPGHLTVFSLVLTNYLDLPELEEKTYTAESFRGTYSNYLKLNMPNGGNIDSTTTRASVYVYNYSTYAESGLSLDEHLVSVNENEALGAGQYIVKLEFKATDFSSNASIAFFQN